MIRPKPHPLLTPMTLNYYRSMPPMVTVQAGRLSARSVGAIRVMLQHKMCLSPTILDSQLAAPIYLAKS